MKSGKSFDSILEEAERIARVWEANPDFSMGDLKLADFKASIQSLRNKRQSVNETRTLLTRLVNEANDEAGALVKLSTRVRGGYRAQYGPNSSQYEQAGGTRETERKPRKSGSKKAS